MESTLPLLMFAALAVFLFSGYPVGLVLGGVGIAFGFIGYLLGEFRLIQFYTLVPRMWGGAADNLLLVAVPMFIFMGTLLEKTGVADDLLRALQILLRRFPGSLALSVVGLGTILAAMTGIVGASVVLITMLTLPTLLKQNYSPALSTGIIAASGTLGILIPPSIMLVVMAEMIGVSVGQLFLAAVIPGFLLAGLYFAYAMLVGIVAPRLAPPMSDDAVADAGNLPILMLKSFLPPVLLIALVLGSIFAGWATVTEASAVGALGAFILALLNRRLDRATLSDVIDRSTRMIGMVFLVILGATTFSYVFRALGGDHMVRDFVEALGLGPWPILFILMLIIFLLGFFFDWIEIVLIALPVFLPIVGMLDFEPHLASSRDLPLWFGMLVAINLQTSFLTPPFGFALFYLKGVAPPEISIGHIYRGVVPFILLQMIGLGLVIAFPQIVLWLPRLVLD